MLRYQDRRPAVGVPAWFDLEMRLGWRATDHLELAIAGQNLLDYRRTEFIGDFLNGPVASIRRTVFATAEWTF